VAGSEGEETLTVAHLQHVCSDPREAEEGEIEWKGRMKTERKGDLDRGIHEARARRPEEGELHACGSKRKHHYASGCARKLRRRGREESYFTVSLMYIYERLE